MTKFRKKPVIIEAITFPELADKEDEIEESFLRGIQPINHKHKVLFTQEVELETSGVDMQQTLFDFKKPTDELIKTATFQGADINQERDGERLKKQIWRIFEYMKDGKWRTLDEISKACKAPHASASAQLRNLKKSPFNHGLEKEYQDNGLYKYKLVVNE